MSILNPNRLSCGLSFALYSLVLLSLLSGCSDKSLPAAPINSEPTLQKLADAYTELKTNLPVSPSGLNPQGKRKFVEQVFEKAGYSYSKTLIALAETSGENRTQYYQDLKQLILLPSAGLSSTNFPEIYSPEEISAISKMEE